MAFEIARAGWIQRQSSVLKRWKRNWLVLYQDGSLKYFESPDSHTAEEAYQLPQNCLAVYGGEQVIGDPPPGLDRTCMFSILLKDETTVVFCAEGPDDMSAWKMSLEEACSLRTRSVSAPPFIPPNGFPGQVLAYPGPDGQMIYSGAPPPFGQPQNNLQGQTTVIYTDDPYYYDDMRYGRGRHYGRRGYGVGGMGMGLVGGMALGSLMWGPMMW